ncbi:MAG: hypothetical protein Q9M26_09475 [Mariprofundales bacterium]|nr:hypothetical protein [Mariprofundales bacterium]
MEHFSQLDTIYQHLTTIRRNMESVIGENRRLRDALSKASEQLTTVRDQASRLEKQQREHDAKHKQVSQCVDDALELVKQLQLNIDDEAEEAPE